MQQLMLHMVGHRVEHVIVDVIQALPVLIYKKVMAFVAVMGHRNATNGGVVDLSPFIKESVIVISSATHHHHRIEDTFRGFESKIVRRIAFLASCKGDTLVHGCTIDEFVLVIVLDLSVAGLLAKEAERRGFVVGCIEAEIDGGSNDVGMVGIDILDVLQPEHATICTLG